LVFAKKIINKSSYFQQKPSPKLKNLGQND
jgi:hypothetical protein